MSGFVNLFVSNQHERLVGFMLWLATTLALLAAALWFARAEFHDSLRRDAIAELAHLDTVQSNITNAFKELQATVTASPCSRPFMQQLRRVAFLPDGLNKFMYAPGGTVTCSTSLSDITTSRSLGPPDFMLPSDDEISVWVTKRLDDVGLPDINATIVAQEPFAIVVPRQDMKVEVSSWVEKELVLRAPDGRVWHLDGARGLFSHQPEADVADQRSNSALRQVVCGEDHAYCVAVGARFSDALLNWRMEIALAFGLIAFYAIWPASAAHRAIKRYWSLEARFRRNLNPESIVCAYQPILDLGSGKISGCEVLVRWRDVDGSLVFPDKFIDIVARSDNTLAFTRMVAECAHAELSQVLPADTQLQVNFNVFPRDLDCEKLANVFSAFTAESDRFPLALEIIESDALAVDQAQHEIEALAEKGIRTYIDDFGSGYSSIHRVASLAIHGVKLDRSFAMAPSESLMAKMLVHALDMIASLGREIVVEGVETQERLDLLVKSGCVGKVQGYLISRPVSIDQFAAFLKAHKPDAFKPPTQAAA
ncbi:hypothetical protein W911_15690 [Hyphomicrobium nitrativorans NL23]|uniref:cyclic-guanylate-specific phosphodiesterase n=1 Tax=Hyphomicrobium nitrativorans NL23 TaxID=1029756 RepID=V5SJW8_9HYPH|nr:cyclic diguanylate phosphodiesterase [Hyphomicrobium nitrativorans]AHB50390.1 hypothetical protein W911_15690 [Hyphomicrobium nitrativorans NL23]